MPSRPFLNSTLLGFLACCSFILAACGVAPTPAPAPVVTTPSTTTASSNPNSEPLTSAINLYADGSTFKLNLPDSISEQSTWSIEPADLGSLKGQGRTGEYLLPSTLAAERTVTLHFSVPGAVGGFERTLQLNIRPVGLKSLANPTGPAGSTFCGNEGQSCTFTGSKIIAYGANGAYYYRGATGQIDCNNLVFTDPLGGVVKGCFVLSTPLPAGPASTIFCAFEGQTCAMPAPHTVSYGAQNTFRTLASNGIWQCNNGEFGDPLPGVVKACYISVAVIQPVAPAGSVYCSLEGQRCTFVGSKTVTYGFGDKFVSKDFTDGVNCLNTVFGDPLPGKVKACFVKDVVPPDDKEDPLPLPGTDPIYLSSPVVSQGAAFNFGLGVIKADSFNWTFSDGTTASGQYVEHLFTAPGIHTATVVVRRDSGESQTYTAKVSVIPELYKAIAKHNLLGSRTVSWDLGAPLPGLSYVIDLGNGQTSDQSKGSYEYAKAGTYVVDLKIKDVRSGLGPLTLRAQALDDTAAVLHDQTWVTSWFKAPEAKFAMNSTNGSGNPVAIGLLKHTVTFDASGSKDNNSPALELKYEWSVDGQVAGEGITFVRTFPTEGRNLVTLKVKNAEGMSSEYRAWVYTQDKRANVRLRITQKNPVAPLALTADDQYAGRGGLRAQDVTDEVKQFLPYVLPSTHEVTAGGFFSLGVEGDRRQGFCNSLLLSVNGSDKTTLGNPLFVDPNDPLFCNGMQYVRGTIGIIPVATLNEVLQTSSLYMNSVRVSTVASLAVPLVTISVFPDEYILGDQASPITDERTFVDPVTGKTQWIVNVRIRESELKNNEISFEVPTMALNPAGRFLTTVNGRMKTKFLSTLFQSDCGDCIFVGGRSKIRVTMPRIGFTVGQSTLDMSAVSVDTEAGCATVNSELGFYTLGGCSVMPTSRTYPTGNVPVISSYNRPVPTKLLNHVVFGETGEKVQAFKDHFNAGLWENVKEFANSNLSYIPFIGSFADFVDSLNDYRENGASLSTVTGLFLSTAGLVGDVLPVIGDSFSAASKTFKASKLGNGKVAKAFEDKLMPLVIAKNKASDTYDAFRAKFGAYLDISKICKDKCTRFMDAILGNELPAGTDPADALESISKKLGSPLLNGKNDITKLSLATVSAICPANNLIKALEIKTEPYVCKRTYVDFVKSYSRAKKVQPRVSDNTAMAFRGQLQGHHGIQEKWALECLKKSIYPNMTLLYSKYSAPVVMLESNYDGGFDGKNLGFTTQPGLPHYIISLEQEGRDPGRGNWCIFTLQDQLNFAVNDLAKASMNPIDIKCTLIFNYDMLAKLGLLRGTDFQVADVQGDLLYNDDQAFRDSCYARLRI